MKSDDPVSPPSESITFAIWVGSPQLPSPTPTTIFLHCILFELILKFYYLLLFGPFALQFWTSQTAGLRGLRSI